MYYNNKNIIRWFINLIIVLCTKHLFNTTNTAYVNLSHQRHCIIQVHKSEKH